MGAWGQAAPRFEDYLVADTAFLGKMHPPVYVSVEQERLLPGSERAAIRRPNSWRQSHGMRERFPEGGDHGRGG